MHALEKEGSHNQRASVRNHWGREDTTFPNSGHARYSRVCETNIYNIRSNSKRTRKHNLLLRAALIHFSFTLDIHIYIFVSFMRPHRNESAHTVQAGKMRVHKMLRNPSLHTLCNPSMGMLDTGVPTLKLKNNRRQTHGANHPCSTGAWLAEIR